VGLKHRHRGESRFPKEAFIHSEGLEVLDRASPRDLDRGGTVPHEMRTVVDRYDSSQSSNTARPPWPRDGNASEMTLFILCDLGACNDIERGIGSSNSRGISHSIRNPSWGRTSLAPSNLMFSPHSRHDHDDQDQHRHDHEAEADRPNEKHGWIAACHQHGAAKIFL
jgi:hypothetical protein